VSAAYLWALSIYLRLTFKIYSSVIFIVLRNNCTAVDTFFLVLIISLPHVGHLMCCPLQDEKFWAVSGTAHGHWVL
jgi:hypothetical protein